MAKLRVTMAEIKSETAFAYGLSVAEIEGRYRQAVEARKVAMYLCSTLSSRSYREIGRAFANRDHSTVFSAVRDIEKALLTDFDIEIEAKVILIRRALAKLAEKPLEDRI